LKNPVKIKFQKCRHGNTATLLANFSTVLNSGFFIRAAVFSEAGKLDFSAALDASFKAISQIHLSVKLSVKRLKTVLFGSAR
jgi:hypothetical protein